MPSEFIKRDSGSSKFDRSSNKFSNYASIGVTSEPVGSQSGADSKPSDVSLKFETQVRTRGKVKMAEKQSTADKPNFIRPSINSASGDSVKNQLSQIKADGDETPMLNFAAFNSNEGDSGKAAQKILAPTRLRTMLKEEQEKLSNDSSIRNFLQNNFYRSIEPSPAGIRIPLGNNDDTP